MIECEPRIPDDARTFPRWPMIFLAVVWSISATISLIAGLYTYFNTPDFTGRLIQVDQHTQRFESKEEKLLILPIMQAFLSLPLAYKAYNWESVARRERERMRVPKAPLLGIDVSELYKIVAVCFCGFGFFMTIFAVSQCWEVLMKYG
jgi:tellurite resistance protein TehA-like permease